MVPEIDVLTAGEAGLIGRLDPEVLAWAAENDRVVLTQDMRTMIAFANARVRQGMRMPGIVQIRATATVNQAIDAIILLDACSEHSEYPNRVVYFPYPEAPKTP